MPLKILHFGYQAGNIWILVARLDPCYRLFEQVAAALHGAVRTGARIESRWQCNLLEKALAALTPESAHHISMAASGHVGPNALGVNWAEAALIPNGTASQKPVH